MSHYAPYLAKAGTTLLIVALFSPIFRMPSGLTYHISGLSAAILFLAIAICIYAQYFGKLHVLLGGASLVVMSGALFFWQAFKTDRSITALLRHRPHELAGHPAAQWGCLPLIWGTFCLFGAAMLAKREHR